MRFYRLLYWHGDFTSLCLILDIGPYNPDSTLEILSNLANDYGDFKNGADTDQRKGPSRSVQSGKISPSSMKRAMILFTVLSFITGLALLYVSLGVEQMGYFMIFLLFGILVAHKKRRPREFWFPGGDLAKNEKH